MIVAFNARFPLFPLRENNDQTLFVAIFFIILRIESQSFRPPSILKYLIYNAIKCRLIIDERDNHETHGMFGCTSINRINIFNWNKCCFHSFRIENKIRIFVSYCVFTIINIIEVPSASSPGHGLRMSTNTNNLS